MEEEFRKERSDDAESYRRAADRRRDAADLQGGQSDSGGKEADERRSVGAGERDTLLDVAYDTGCGEGEGCRKDDCKDNIASVEHAARHQEPACKKKRRKDRDAVFAGKYIDQKSVFYGARR